MYRLDIEIAAAAGAVAEAADVGELVEMANVVVNVWNPPIDKPAIARFSRPGATRNDFSIIGIRSVSIMSVKTALPSGRRLGAGVAPGVGGGSGTASVSTLRAKYGAAVFPGFTAFRFSMTMSGDAPSGRR